MISSIENLLTLMVRSKSIEEPPRYIYYDWGKDYDKRKRGSGKNKASVN